MSHALHCPACGLFGWRRYRRARSAAQTAERGLVAYWQGLGARSRAERRSQQLWWVRRYDGSASFAHDGELRAGILGIDPDAPWLTFRRWLPGDPAPDAADTAGFVGIASAYRHLDTTLNTQAETLTSALVEGARIGIESLATVLNTIGCYGTTNRSGDR